MVCVGSKFSFFLSFSPFCVFYLSVLCFFMPIVILFWASFCGEQVETPSFVVLLLGLARAS